MATFFKQVYQTIFVLIILPFGLMAQQGKPFLDASSKVGSAKMSEILTTEMAGKINNPSADLNWLPSLSAKVVKIKHGTPGAEEVKEIKEAKALLKEKFQYRAEEEEETPENTSTPVVGENFLGNTNNGSSPLDNSMAISNDGLIVSVANTTIDYYLEDGTSTYSNSIVDFIGDPGITYVCDPVVIYDPEADRFIFFAQECSGSHVNSYLLVLFSETNDPADGWNYYKLTGNPLDDNSWFDYPKLAISNNELFITGNLFYTGGGYNQSVVYQMEKNDGYSGTSLTWNYWYDIPGSPGTLLPVSSGNEFNYGPGIYLVSTQPYSGNQIKFYDITNNLVDSPSLNYYTVSTDYYEVAADSEQLGTTCKLDNGDCRCLSGFYLDGEIHFVFQSDAGSGWNGINYNRLDVATLSNDSEIFGNPGTQDYSYPSVVSFGLDAEDHAVMIGFGSVSDSEYPEMRVVHCDGDWNWSETSLVKESFSYVSYTSSVKERWGDYTGTTRRHNADSPTIWMNGMYGTGSHKWNTWIAEIHANYFSGLSEISVEQNPVLVAPNPIVETFILRFDREQDVDVSIQIIDMNGALVQHLYTGTAHVGTNTFSFNQANLAKGTYFLQVNGPNETIANEKIIIQ